MNMMMFDNLEAQIDTIPQLLYNTQSVFGARPAQMFMEDGKWRTITYNDLVYKVENLAMGLMKLGIEPGDWLGIKAHTSQFWTWADMGTNFAGAASVSFYPTLSKAETLFIANDSRIKLMFVGDKNLLIDTLVYLPEMPSVKYLVCLEEDFRGNGSTVFGIGELMHMGAQAREEMMPDMKKRQEGIKGDGPTTMVYTSGTTGVLKGVMLSHKNIIINLAYGFRHLSKYGHTQTYNQIAMCYLPLSHVMEKVNCYYGPIAIGGKIGFSTPPALMNDVQMIKPTWIMFVPRLLARIYLGFENAFSAAPEGKKLWDWAMDVAKRATYELEDEHGRIDMTIPFPDQLTGQLREDWINAYNTVYWRVHHALGGRVWDFNVGGARLEEELHRKYLGMGFMVQNSYGLTETSSGFYHTMPNACKVGYCGVTDEDFEVKLDEDGELLLRSPRIPKGYFNNPRATAENFTEDGWFRTGDIGELDERGQMRIIDRKKNIIMLDTGKNVATARIESLCGNSGLLEQVAILGQDQKFIAALIVPNLDIIVDIFKSKGIPFDESKLIRGEINGIPTVIEVGEDIINNDFLRQAIEGELTRINEQLEEHETVKQFRLLKRRFTEQDGEMTPSGKLKMRVIREKYKDLIDDIYQG